MIAVLWLLLSTEKTDHAKSREYSCEKYEEVTLMNCEEKLKILMDACEQALMYGWEDNFNWRTEKYGAFWDEKEAFVKVEGDKK
jgi:hypothetical protein